MKFLLVLAVVLLAFWIWRSSRKPREPRRGADTPRAIEVVRCDVCGVHCAKAESVPGKLGVYCTTQHRSQAEP